MLHQQKTLCPWPLAQKCAVYEVGAKTKSFDVSRFVPEAKCLFSRVGKGEAPFVTPCLEKNTDRKT
jgi:hypothetical protein